VSHLVALGDRWSLWRWACLRATGFPARLVLELACAALAAAADQLLAREAEEAEAREAMIAACQAALARAAPDDRRPLQRAIQRLRQHQVPEPIADVDLAARRQRLGEAAARRSAAAQALAEQHAGAHRRTSDALRRFAADDRFRQALVWQNRQALRTGVDSLLRQPAHATDGKTRQNERLVASYLQRYCVKNDTIGFFGPCGWARFVDGPVAIAQRPGPALLARRTVYYEHWAIDALAAKLSADPAVRPFIAPRRLPRFRLDGTTLHYPVERQAALPAEFAAVAARCDGMRTARELARALAGDPALGLADEADVFDVLDELVASQLIHWRFEIPTAGAHPEHHLAALLARIDDRDARDRAEAVLDELQRGRARLAACTDAAQLEAALAGFEAVFTRVTDADSRRAPGQTYAGRTPLYEDCRRDLELELGDAVRARLAAPLQLVLDSARWYTHEIAARYRDQLTAIYRRLRGPAPDGPASSIDYARFWQEVPALFPGRAAPGSIVGAVRDELHRRWADVLAIDPAEPAVQRSAADLAGAVHRTFAAPGPGWPSARHHSPDVMIAAASAAALSRGDFRIVLGELHTGFATISGPFLKLHPAPDELIAARDADLERACIAPVWSSAMTNSDYYSLSPRDLDLEHGEARSARPRSHVLSTGELVVDERDGRLEVRTRDGMWRFDIIAFLEHHLIAESFSAFSPIGEPVARSVASPPAAGSPGEPRWTPRVTIDDVVIARATWRFAPVALAWPALKDAPARFVAARRWARSLGMPRWVFVKTAEEVKPVYVDFDSTVYVEALAKQLRGASSAALSEMLPSVDEAWVEDAAGARYTAELRIVAVDREAWRPDR
jgi:hypothetical protein